MTDSIAETEESVSGSEADVDGLEDLPNPDPNGEDVGENTSDLLDLLTSSSPNKDLDDYQGHTFDFDESDSTRRIIRGLEGLLGEVNYALADVVIGFAQKISGLQESGEESDGWEPVP